MITETYTAPLRLFFVHKYFTPAILLQTQQAVCVLPTSSSGRAVNPLPEPRVLTFSFSVHSALSRRNASLCRKCMNASLCSSFETSAQALENKSTGGAHPSCSISSISRDAIASLAVALRLTFVLRRRFCFFIQGYGRKSSERGSRSRAPLIR